ncbi:hypothetical protein QQY79_03810 [Flavobacterium tructae]|uniref:hypothetical protein n=1 Tax=Flavobacterium tructae TaxID=1114873 RepID=UPI002551D758|nr:hypothetical protein [Flavobacterium tructae]MDL2141635.1 hypothetical protein [Flavobacterium tructae]
MKITDLVGCTIEVTDLKKAIEMAREYKEYCHANGSFAKLDKRQKIYWTDIYEKLVAIKRGLENN